MMFTILRRFQTYILTSGKKSYLCHGRDLHVGWGTRLWAPKSINIGNHVYIGKQVHIEANCDIGDYCLIANRVAIIGRNDHDFMAVGYPVRYAPWVGSLRMQNTHVNEKVVIESDVWIGFGAILLTKVTIGKGSVVAAGSVVTCDVPPYSIAAGVPARVIGRRFEDDTSIVLHELAIKNGKFTFSERGYDYCVIQPALLNQ